MLTIIYIPLEHDLNNWLIIFIIFVNIRNVNYSPCVAEIKLMLMIINITNIWYLDVMVLALHIIQILRASTSFWQSLIRRDLYIRIPRLHISCVTVGTVYLGLQMFRSVWLINQEERILLINQSKNASKHL